MGMDVEWMERGIATLRGRFCHLTPSLVRYHSAGGLILARPFFPTSCRTECPVTYSSRSACIGSIFVTRRAGK